MSDILERITAALNESSDAMREVRAGLVLERVFPEEQCDGPDSLTMMAWNWFTFESRVACACDCEHECDDDVIELPLAEGPARSPWARFIACPNDAEAMDLEIYQPPVVLVIGRAG